VARTIAEHWSKFKITSFKDGNAGTKMVILDCFTDVELVCLDPM
jgi:hypothetical protein